MTDPTTSAPAPTGTPVAEPIAPVVVDKTLAQFRAERATPPVDAPAAPVAPASEPSRSPLAAAPEPDEPADEPEDGGEAAAADATRELKHKWKSETGVTLDLRRRDHRKIKRDYEELAALRARLSQPPPAVPQPPSEPARAPQAAAPIADLDPNDPEPTLDQFADSPDPYGAYVAATARWHARAEHRTQTAQRSAVERTQRTQAAIESAQQRFDADLPTVRERYPDFDAAYDELHATLARVPVPVRLPIVHRLLTGEHRHDLAYFLGNHPTELQRLVTARTPHEQAVVMGEVIASVKAALKAPTPAPLNPAPAPMAPVNSGGTPTTYNPATATLAQHRAKHGVLGGRRVRA